MDTANQSPVEPEILAQRNRELLILNKIAQTLNEETDLNQALDSTLTQVLELFKLNTGWIWLLHADTEKSYLAAAQNLPPALGNNPAKMDGSCFCINTFRDGDMTGAANINAIICSRLENLVDGTEGIKYHSSVPIYAHGKRLGILNVGSEDWEEIGDDDLQTLHTIGDMLGTAIERARLFSQSLEMGATVERNRLAREIHDTLAQDLAGITLQLETAEALMDANEDPQRVKEIVHHALLQARTGLEEARRSVLDLRAVPLENRSLAEALTALTKQQRKAHPETSIHLKIVGANQPLTTRIEVGLYRIIQEAFNNALEHAEATEIHLYLEITPQQVIFTIKDNGRGFDPAQATRGGYGLIGLNERVKLLGGVIDLQTEEQAGAQITVRLEIEHDKTN